jgi:archaellum component FlaC
MEEEEQGNVGNEQDDEDIEEYMPNDDEVDDFGESPHSSPTQANGEENAMDDIDFRDI